MSGNSIFRKADEIKAALMASQQKEIESLYNKWADELESRAEFYKHKTTSSSGLSERYYRELQKQLRQASQEISNNVYRKIKNNIYVISDAVVRDNIIWLKSLGFKGNGLDRTFSSIPLNMINLLVSGKIYDSNWSLSSKIWKDNERTLRDIYTIMAKGLAENKPIYEITKDLEKYVRPNVILPWNLKMSDGKKIYKKKVDYHAQRLARTMVQHSYQQTFIQTTKDNPFVEDYIWRSDGSRPCPICLDRNGRHYKKDELPMDHPNGMCSMEPNITENLKDKIEDWFKSPDGTYPEIDKFAKNFGYEP